MSKWEDTRIKDIAHVIGGGTPSTNVRDYWNGNISWITPKDLTTSKAKYIYSGERSITQQGLEKSSARLLPQGSVLLTSRAPIGYVAIAKNELATNQGFKNLVINNTKAFNEFIYYWLINSKEYLNAIGTGTTFQEISGSVVKDIEIKLPPLPEQKAIAGVLSSLDDKIDLLHRQNKTLEAMAETLFKQWFIEEAEDDWEKLKLSDIAVIKIGRTPPRKEQEWFSMNSDDIKWISIKDLGEHGVYIFNTAERLTKKAVERFSIPRIPPNSVVLSFKMTVGRVSITSEEMLSNEAIAQFQLKNGSGVGSEYLYLFLKQYKYDSLGSTSSIVTAINSAMIRDIDITIPCLSKLTNFDELVTPMFKKIRENQAQIYHLHEVRDVLLPKLMSGEVRVEI